MLARRNAMTAVRRTAATAAPVLVTVGIAGSLGGIAVPCVAVALLASLIPASLALRRPPLELAGGHE